MCSDPRHSGIWVNCCSQQIRRLDPPTQSSVRRIGQPASPQLAPRIVNTLVPKLATMILRLHVVQSHTAIVLDTVRYSVLAFISDYGVESKLVAMPRINITTQWIRDTLARENPRFLTYIDCDGIIPLLKRLSPDVLESGHSDVHSSRADVTDGADWVNKHFPNAIYIPGPRHGMRNLSQDRCVGSHVA
jgi:hypothetical protein